MRIFLKLFWAILFGVCSSHVTAADAETRQADVVVYGDLDLEMSRKKFDQAGAIKQFLV